MLSLVATALLALRLVPIVSGHSAIFHPSMFGFNVTDKTFPYDNRPVAPLRSMTFQQWWFHNHLDHPPNPGDFFELPAGKPATAEIACNKGATSYFASADGGDIRDPNNPNNVCPGSPTQTYHTNGIDDLKGCGLAIAYKSDAKQVQPEDFTIFSVNQTCVWTRFTDFQVPAKMPPCPDGGCTCAFFWVHSPKAGGEENYMNGFKCNVTGSTSTVPVAKSQVPRRCGADTDNQKLQSAPGNCTYGAKQPFYWFNLERNNMFEGAFSPPVYNDLYNFLDGAQDDIFEDSYDSIPNPSPIAPVPTLRSANSQRSNSTMETATVDNPIAESDTAANSTMPKAREVARTCGRRATGDSSSSFAARSLDGRWAQNAKRSVVGMRMRSRRLTARDRNRLWHMW
ncbi:hypothetical protein BDQ12DRAFT_635058 [Crucibulum laeve]|uniref:Lytic polysaccharide monooxygenase n=1 Tax=Crucibulum laeve TaxID=68775 RepID=A0A5C3LS50_9AGAR|nr:hypothetical protein BDQ12DRAFT_635058 [Crucibulum laeve]